MIIDTCPCGAKFEISARPADELTQHVTWLNKHSVCREARAASEPVWPDPVSPFGEYQKAVETKND